MLSPSYRSGLTERLAADVPASTRRAPITVASTVQKIPRSLVRTELPHSCPELATWSLITGQAASTAGFQLTRSSASLPIKPNMRASSVSTLILPPHCSPPAVIMEHHFPLVPFVSHSTGHFDHLHSCTHRTHTLLAPVSVRSLTPLRNLRYRHHVPRS